MQIRKLEAKDKAVFQEMVHKFYHSPATMTVISEEDIQRFYQAALAQNPYFDTFLIEEETEAGLQVVGYFVLAYTWYTEFAGLIVIIDEIYIDESMRGKGLGTQVFAYLQETYAKKPEYKGIRLEYSRSNERAVKLYRSLGYEDWDYGQMFYFFQR